MSMFWFFSKPEAGANNYASSELSEQLKTSRYVLWGAAVTLAVLLLWAYFAQLDQITRAPGAVIASSRSQIIQSQEGGVLEELLVKEGDIVEEGALLARIEPTRAESAFFEVQGKSASLQATVARLNAEVYGGALKFPEALAQYPEFERNQRALFDKRNVAGRDLGLYHQVVF